MRLFFTLIFLWIASPAFAACQDDFLLHAPKAHDMTGCDIKEDAAYHFNLFDAAHQTVSLRKQGKRLNIQFKYNGDWLITPTRIQLVPYYLEQVRKYDGKLVFEDDSRATYKYFHDNQSHWLELTFVGDGIHVLKQVTQNGIVLDAEYNVPQMKSRIKRYGKIVFYELDQNAASLAKLVDFIDTDGRNYYIVSHVYGHTPLENDALSAQQANAIYDKLIANGVLTSQIIARGVGASSPIKNPSSLNAKKKNIRVELVLRN